MHQHYYNLIAVLALFIAMAPYIGSFIVWAFPWVTGTEKRETSKETRIIHIQRQPKKGRCAAGKTSSITTRTSSDFAALPLEPSPEDLAEPIQSRRPSMPPKIMGAMRTGAKMVTKTLPSAVLSAVDNVPNPVKNAMQYRRHSFMENSSSVAPCIVGDEPLTNSMQTVMASIPNMTPTVICNNAKLPSCIYSESSPEVTNSPKQNITSNDENSVPDSDIDISRSAISSRTIQHPTQPMDMTTIDPLTTSRPRAPDVLSRRGSYQIADQNPLSAISEFDEASSGSNLKYRAQPKVTKTISPRPKMMRSQTSQSWSASKKAAKSHMPRMFK